MVAVTPDSSPYNQNSEKSDKDGDYCWCSGVAHGFFLHTPLSSYLFLIYYDGISIAISSKFAFHHRLGRSVERVS